MQWRFAKRIHQVRSVVQALTTDHWTKHKTQTQRPNHTIVTILHCSTQYFEAQSLPSNLRFMPVRRAPAARQGCKLFCLPRGSTPPGAHRYSSRTRLMNETHDNRTKTYDAHTHTARTLRGLMRTLSKQGDAF